MNNYQKRFRFYAWTGALWLITWTIHSLLNYQASFLLRVLNEVWLVIFFVAVNFIFFEYALAVLRKIKPVFYRVLAGIMIIMLQLVSVSFGLYAWTQLGMLLNIYTPFRFTTLTGGVYAELLEDVFYQAQIGITSTLFFWFAKLYYDNFKLKQTTQQLQLEKKEAELNFLKSQTNPHFLFNTLNNIFTLVSDHTELAQESIVRLSKILRFMLYETNRPFITVEEELGIINDYIALEKLRYDDSLSISTTYEIEEMNQALPPLVLLPLVENAFKHGSAETMDKPFINIFLSTRNEQLVFEVSNSIEDIPERVELKENIGLSNLRRQLLLLYKDHDLSVQRRDSTFTAKLKINLGSHV